MKLLSRIIARYILWLITIISWTLILLLIVLAIVVAIAWMKDQPVSPFFSALIRTLNIGNDTWDWIAVSLSCVSLFYACLTFNSQWQTEQNTMKITPESQIEILLDHIRHYYRNLVIICAVDAKLGNRFSEYYPSEEHLLKLKLSTDDLHPAAFYNHIDKFKAIHELLMKMRNFNTEVDVVTKHLCSQGVSTKAKRRDFATLKFKMSYLAEETYKTMNKIWPNKKEYNLESIRNLIIEKETSYNKALLPQSIEYLNAQDDKTPYFNNTDTFYTTVVFKSDDEKKRFIFMLNVNIDAELKARETNGFSDSEKIFLIPFAD